MHRRKEELCNILLHRIFFNNETSNFNRKEKIFKCYKIFKPEGICQTSSSSRKFRSKPEKWHVCYSSQNFKAVATELYKVHHGLAIDITKDIFKIRNVKYNFKNHFLFATRNVKSVIMVQNLYPI